jgi:hypothetical protein
MQKFEDYNIPEEQDLLMAKPLKTSWTVWESFSSAPNSNMTQEEFSNQINKLFKISTLNDFVHFFGILPHGKPINNIFSNKMETKK